MKECVLIIDAESMVYNVCSRLSVAKQMNFQAYIDEIDTKLNTLLAKFKTNKYLIILDNNFPTFRHDQYPGYKSNRSVDPLDKPKFFFELKSHLISYWNAYKAVNKLEADDECLIAANYYKDKYRVVICAIDKDLLQIPGEFYNYNKDELITIDEKQAYHRLWMQVLAGDSADNIKGIPGVGKINASKILDEDNGYDLSYKTWLAYSKKYGLYKGTIEMTKNLLAVNLLKRINDVEEIIGEPYYIPSIREIGIPNINEDMPF